MNRSAAAATEMTGLSRWIIFSPKGIIIPGDTSDPIAFFESVPVPLEITEYLGDDQGTRVFAGYTTQDYSDDPHFRIIHLRSIYKTISAELFQLAGYASEVISWRKNFRFCGVCGSLAERSPTERAMICPSCNHMAFPRISPAIIVAITNGEKVLLASNTNFPQNQYSVLAGFVDPGESAEDAVVREVMEEVSIRIKNIRYVTSQAWPFPDSLMLGYTAEYDSGDIVPDGVEIIDARWFSVEDLHSITIPGKQAIARRLMETVLGPIDRE